jgi:hypothetical protein
MRDAFGASSCRQGRAAAPYKKARVVNKPHDTTRIVTKGFKELTGEEQEQHRGHRGSLGYARLCFDDSIFIKRSSDAREFPHPHKFSSLQSSNLKANLAVILIHLNCDYDLFEALAMRIHTHSHDSRLTS